MNMKSSELISAWDGLPEDPCIAYYGGDLVIRGRRIDLSHFKQYTETERLDALITLIQSKDYLVIAPSTCGSYVPISQMEPDSLIAAATYKAKMESLAIIDPEILPVFTELASLLTDPEPSTASQALEDLQDMVFDQSLRKLSKCQLKYFFYYLDDVSNNLVMVLGNRKIISFDAKKVKALQRQMAGINPTPPKSNKRKPKAKAPSSSSQSSYSSSSGSSDEDSNEDGTAPEGARTPVLHPPPPLLLWGLLFSSLVLLPLLWLLLLPLCLDFVFLLRTRLLLMLLCWRPSRKSLLWLPLQLTFNLLPFSRLLDLLSNPPLLPWFLYQL